MYSMDNLQMVAKIDEAISVLQEFKKLASKAEDDDSYKIYDDLTSFVVSFESLNEHLSK